VIPDVPVADDHVGLVGQDRRDQLRQVVGAVLVVGIRVDDHVGAELQSRVEPRLERDGKPLVRMEADDVVDPVLARDLRRAVGGAVVDDEPFDGVEPLDLARQVRQRGGKDVLLVQARNLDDQLHRDRQV
jgi:hypothetical protein